MDKTNTIINAIACAALVIACIVLVIKSGFFNRLRLRRRRFNKSYLNDYITSRVITISQNKHLSAKTKVFVLEELADVLRELNY